MNPLDTEVTKNKLPHELRVITPLSKYLAMVSFILMPFVGGYIGYQFARKDVVLLDVASVSEMSHTATTTQASSTTTTLATSTLLESPEEEFLVPKELTFTLLYTTPDKEAYYESGVQGSSACCGIAQYDYKTRTFVEVAHRDIINDKFSPSKKFFAKPRAYGEYKERIEIISTETGVPVASIENSTAGVTFADSNCGYDGSTFDINWKSDSVLSYGVYKSDSADSCKRDLIEYRELTI